MCKGLRHPVAILLRVPTRLVQKYALRDVKGVCLKEVVVRSYSKSPMD